MIEKGILIGCTGYALAGKDEFANCLTKHHGYVKLGFSDALWNLALTLNPWLKIYGFIPVKLQWLANRYSYTKCKEFPAVRKYLQWLGTEAVRRCLGDDAWVNALMPRIEALRNEGRNVVVTNVRFPNEGAAIQEAGGVIVLIERPGTGPVNEHSSDAGLAFPMAEFRVRNEHGIKELEAYAIQLHQILVNRYYYQQAQQEEPPTLKIYLGDAPDVHHVPVS